MEQPDIYFELLRQKTSERGWSEHQQMFIGSMIVPTTCSMEFAEKLIDQVLQIEDGIRAELDEAVEAYDRVFNPAGFKRSERAKE